MKVKEESEKVGLKFNIQKTKIMAFGPITSWQIDGEAVETVLTLYFWVSKPGGRPGSKQGRRAPCCPFMAASVAVLLMSGDRVQYKFGVLEPNN